MGEITYSDALNHALKEEMRRDEKVFLMGESIRGGIYGVTGGLSQEFDKRVIKALYFRFNKSVPVYYV